MKNRSTLYGIPPAPPSQKQIRELRVKAGLTQTEAAQSVHKTTRQWQRWEAGEPPMPPSTWELFVLKMMHRGIAPPDYLEPYLRQYITTL